MVFHLKFFSQEDVLWSALAKQIKKESVTVVYAQLPKLQQWPQRLSGQQTGRFGANGALARHHAAVEINLEDANVEKYIIRNRTAPGEASKKEVAIRTIFVQQRLQLQRQRHVPLQNTHNGNSGRNVLDHVEAEKGI